MTAPAIDSGVDSGDRVPQAHGGALLRGGKPGNRGGLGRLPDRIRRRARRDLWEVQGLLKEWAQGIASDLVDPPTVSERKSAVELLHKIGMGETVPVSDIRVRLKAQLRTIREMLPPEQADAVCKALGEVWR